MPLASPESIALAQNILLTGSHLAKRTLLRKTPINPPSGIVRNGAGAAFTKLKLTDNDDMLCFIRFKAIDSVQVGAMTFETRFPHELPKVADRAGWIPCWFLPWLSGRIVKLKIADVATTPTIDFGPGSPIDPMPNPDLFFTAGINGCSVFAVGNARNPSMYHGGIDPGALEMRLNDNETTEMAWRRMLGRAGTVKFIGSVGKSDYVSELNDPATTDDTNRFRRNGLKTTRRVAELEAALEAKGTLTRVNVLPWGAVFGLRDTTGAWSMTLVTNATVSYKRVLQTVKKRFLRADKVTITHQGEMRQEGNITAERDIVNSYNMGSRDFFPGAGVAQVRLLPTDQIF